MGAKPTAIDLFAGCGGITFGLKDAGYEVVGAVEIDPHAAAAYELNHPEVHLVKRDIREVVDPREEFGSMPLDLLAGGPPCQGFSRIRTKNRRTTEDARNELFAEYLRFVEVLKPRCLLFENVPQLENDDRFQLLQDRLKELGYKLAHKICNAADYGVPQRRKRLILLGRRDGEQPRFQEVLANKRSVRDAIAGLGVPGEGSDPLHDKPEFRAPAVIELIKSIPLDGGSRKDSPYDVDGRMAWNDVSPTITGGCVSPSKGRFLHPEQHRSITLREASLLQGFPATFRLPEKTPKYTAALIIGNAVPPPFAAAHAANLMA
jgi:DNA (cytosine-5)-methyltransferase 1